MIKGVFLDLYGTLIVTGEMTASGWLNELYSCLRSSGLSLSKEDFIEQCQGFYSKDEPPKGNDGLSIYELRLKRLSTELGLEVDIKGVKQIAASTIAAANNHCFIDPDCHFVLQSLQKRKTLALISNFDHSPHVKDILRRMDLEKYFTTVIVSEEAGIKKPSPDIFRLALHKTGLKPEEVIHVGDSIVDDISGAVSAGITPILIRRNPFDIDHLSAMFSDDYVTETDSRADRMPKPLKTIRRLTELIEIVD